MTSMNLTLNGASPASQWSTLPWVSIEKEVKRLQVRIAKATKEGKKGKVKALQRLLTCSFYAKCLAVRRVVNNKGASTPGVDGILWRTSCQRMKAVKDLKRKGYSPLPSRRIHIPKKNPKGGKRPLSIPCMKDRAMQALWQLALDPIAEEMADPNSYGFRPKRSVADAIQQCFIVLSRKISARWVLEGDIKACFDRLSHAWLEQNIPMDKTILRKFLKAGFMEKGVIYPVTEGAAQGGVISPTITLIALSGLEAILKEAFKNEKVNTVVYADDFIITGNCKELLEYKVVPIVESFMKERGLELNREKSKITHVEEGFNFLGHNIRRYRRGLLTMPSKANVKNFLQEVRKTIKSNQTAKTEDLIKQLNPKILGWAHFFRYSAASRTFSYVDKEIYEALSRWMKKRHPTKRKTWRNKKYFRQVGNRNWQFSTKIRKGDGTVSYLDLAVAQKVSIRRYVKIRGKATPYDLRFKEYFEKRDRSKHVSPGSRW